MTPTFLIAVALAGLLFGSFLNVCIARLPMHNSIVRPASHCPHCKAAIRPWQNIPLLSFLVLRGRCASCKAPIAWRYPLVEAGLAGLWVASAWRFGIGLSGIEAAVFCFLMLGLLVMDAETMRLPNSFTYPGIVLGLTQAWLPGSVLAALHLSSTLPFPLHAELPTGAASALAAIVAATLLATIRWLYQILRKQEGMGIGDIKLAALLGAWLGTMGAGLALGIGVVGGAIGGIWLLQRSRAGARTKLPLGSFLCVGGLIALFLGRNILAWYFHFWV